MKIKNLTIAIFLLSLLNINLAYAKGGDFTVYPSYKHDNNKHWIIHEITQAKAITDYITLENLSPETQKISLITKEAFEEKDVFQVKEDSEAEWITLPQTEYELKAYEKIKIPLNISINENSLKKHTGVIYAVKKDIKNGMQIITRIGVRIYVNLVAENMLTANVAPFRESPKNLFFILSAFGVIAALGYNLMYILENKKHGKHT